MGTSGNPRKQAAADEEAALASEDGGGIHPKIAQAFSMVTVGAVLIVLGLLLLDGGASFAFVAAGIGLCIFAFVSYNQGYRETNAKNDES